MGYEDEQAERIVIDIETISAPDAAEYLKLEEIEAPSNYKDPIKIADYIGQKRRERIEKAGLEADLCEVVAVGWLRDTYGVATAYTRQDVSEREMLEALWSVVGFRATIGFNTLGFDLPVLIRRSQLLGIAHPTLDLGKYRSPHIDLMEKLNMQGRLATRSLAFYCRRFSIPSTDQTSGADIAQMVAAGNWNGVEAHCRADVEKTAALARRLGYLPQASTVEYAEVVL